MSRRMVEEKRAGEKPAPQVGNVDIDADSSNLDECEPLLAGGDGVGAAGRI